MALIVSKKRPKCLILAVTPTESIYRRLFLLQGIYPILSTAMKIKTKKGISKLKDSLPEHPISPTTPNTPKDGISPNGTSTPIHRNTDYILARGERDILQFLKQSPLVKKSHFLSEGDTVVYCAGFHGPFPGLSNTIRLAKFGEAIHGINARQLWGEAMQLVKER
jgi:pyruvate kinase